MADMNRERLTELWRIMERYSFRVDQPCRNLVCAVCKMLMIDAYKGHCECRYCRKCIEGNLNKIGRFCPGQCTDLKMETLAIGRNIFKEYSIDMEIGNLTAKCPLELCEHYCKLLDMPLHIQTCNEDKDNCPYKEIGCQIVLPSLKMIEHSRLCTKRPQNCPYSCMGCLYAVEPNSDIIHHLRTNVYSHNQLLISWAMNLENELSIPNVKRVEIMTRQELTEDIKSLKETRTRSDGEIESLKKTTFELEQQIKSLQHIIAMITVDVKNRSSARAGSEIKVDLVKAQTLAGQSTCEVESRLTETKLLIGSFCWMIEKFALVKKNRGEINSAYFFTNNKVMQLQLWLYPDLFHEQFGSGIRIKLFACDGPNLFFSTEIIISIVNKENTKTFKSISKTVSLTYGFSEIFDFYNFDFEELIKSDFIGIMCEIFDQSN